MPGGTENRQDFKAPPYDAGEMGTGRDMTKNEVTPAAFRAACGRFATGVAIATTTDRDGRKWGLTVNSFSSVSLDPPLVLFSIDKAATSHAPFQDVSHFAVNILCEDQQALSNRFAAVKDQDRFENVDLVANEDRAPLIRDSLCAILCETESRIPGGDHTVMIGRVVGIVMSEDPTAKPLMYYGGGYLKL